MSLAKPPTPAGGFEANIGLQTAKYPKEEHFPLPKPEQPVQGYLSAYSNPFSAERIRPGGLPFLFPSGITPEKLWDRFCRLGGQAQILGGQGSGKTSLIRALLEASPWREVESRVLAIRDRKPGALPALRELRIASPGCLLVVDGFEQWSLPGQILVALYARVRGLRLLVTGHKRSFLPILVELRPEWPLACRLVHLLLQEVAEERLRQGLPPVTIPEPVIYEAFCHSRGNIREMFFRLYDIYEELSRGPRTTSK